MIYIVVCRAVASGSRSKAWVQQVTKTLEARRAVAVDYIFHRTLLALLELGLRDGNLSDDTVGQLKSILITRFPVLGCESL